MIYAEFETTLSDFETAVNRSCLMETKLMIIIITIVLPLFSAGYFSSYSANLS